MPLLQESPVSRLVQTATEQTTLEGISEMLRVVTEELQSWGAVIWTCSPGSDLEDGKGRLFVLGYWIPNPEIQVWHELTLDSMAGSVLKSNRPDRASLGDQRIAKPTPKFIEQSQTTQFCLAPMRMADGSPAVLEVYRVENRAFSDDEMNRLSELATIFPALYATLTDRVGFALQDKISDIRRRADRGEITPLRSAVRQMIEAIDDVFHCLEVSIFLRDVQDEENDFPLFEYLVKWEGPWLEKSSYRPGQGATGYVIANGRSVRIVDLGRYEEDRRAIQSTYPGLEWSNSLHILERARDYFKVNDPESAPPVSFLCAPIRSGINDYGAIRCCGSVRNPFYLDKWQERLLQSVASRIAGWWQSNLRERVKDEDLKGWQRLMRGFDSMNRSVQRAVSRQNWDEANFFREAMRLAHDVIPNTDNSDVRLVEDNELVTTASYGRDWDRFPAARNKRWKLDPPECAASDMVVQRRAVCVYDNIEKAPRLNRIFPDTKKLILVPISAGERIAGVLCIRSKSPRPFPGNTELIAGLIGQQLGLYHSLVTQIGNLQQAERRNQSLIATQARTISDVHHQVKSPILSAYRTSQSVLNSRLLPQLLRHDVGRLRSLSSKVSRVVRNMGMFSDLSTGKPLQLKKQLLERDKLAQMLKEACEDHKATVDPVRQIVFIFDEKSLSELAGKDREGKLVIADTALIEQCVNNLLDNAAKYSYDRTVVHVVGGIQAKGEECFVSISNEGFEVKPEDAAKLKQRGYRSDKAIWSTGEGSGIGLWIVDEIMKAHGGRLAISPTNKNGITDVRLVLPVYLKGLKQLEEETKSVTGRR